MISPIGLLWRFLLRPLGRLRLRLILWYRRLRHSEHQVLHAVVEGKKCHWNWYPSPPTRQQDCVRCVCISDTHLHHHDLWLPPGDILIHCGDVLLESRGLQAKDLDELRRFHSWIAQQPHKHKLLVAGNHDGALQELKVDGVRQILPKCTYLQDESIELEGLKIHASPLSTGQSPNSAFQSQSGYDEHAACRAIPPGLDLLITHGPGGHGALGRASPLLAEHIAAVLPRVHLFGHYHLGHGIRQEEVLFVNASSADALFAMTNPAIVLDIQPQCAAAKQMTGATVITFNQHALPLMLWRLAILSAAIADVGAAAKYLYLILNFPHRIIRMDMDGQNQVVLLDGLGHPHGIAVDDLHKKLYFGLVEDVHLGGVAVDAVNQHIYWTELTEGRVQRSKLDGSEVETLVTDLQDPGGLDLDVAAGRLYWCDQDGWDADSKGRIQTSLLNGSGLSVLHEARFPMDLALDAANQKLYWTDAGTFELTRCNLDGTEVEVIQNKSEAVNQSAKKGRHITGLLDPHGILLDHRGKIYFTLLGTAYSTKIGGPAISRNGKLQRCNLDGSDLETLAEFGSTQPVSLALSAVDAEIGMDGEL
eukprot:s271_g29.t1